MFSGHDLPSKRFLPPNPTSLVCVQPSLNGGTFDFMLHLKSLQLILWPVRTYSNNAYLSKSILNKETDMWPIISHPHVITLLRFHTHVIWPFFMACHAFLNSIPIWLRPHCRKCQSHLYSSLRHFILQIFHWKSTANSLAICMFNTLFSVPDLFSGRHKKGYSSSSFTIT